MLSVLFVIAGLSFLIFIHEAGHFLTAKFFKLKVDEFGFGLPPRAWGKRVGETIYSLNWLPFGGFVKVFGEEGGENITMVGPGEKASAASPDYGRSFNVQPAWKRAIVIAAGVIMNFLVGWLLVSAVFMIGSPEGVIITDVREGSPALSAGFKPGDRLSEFKSAEEFISFVAARKGEEISFSVERGGEAVRVVATPRANPPTGEGPLGVGVAEGGGRLGFFEALYAGSGATLELIKGVFLGIINLLVGLFSGRPNLAGVAGPIGILGVATEVGSYGFVYLLQLLAVISISLGVFNVFPFPALDGGRLFFIIIEKIKGSPLSIKTERLSNGVAFAILLLLMALISIRDVVKWSPIFLKWLSQIAG